VGIDCRQAALLGEGCPAVVHHGAVVVGAAHAVDVGRLLKVVLLARCDVVEQDGDIVVPVRARLLVVEAQCVHHLVLNGACPDTSPSVHIRLEIQRLAAAGEAGLADV